MPIYIKPVEIICKERAEDDAKFYYEYFKELLIETKNENNDAESKINLAKLNRWIEDYKNFATNFHIKNFVRANDIYVDPENAEAFPLGERTIRAPFIDVFGELNANN
jgi:hypothetical protein